MYIESFRCWPSWRCRRVLSAATTNLTTKRPPRPAKMEMTSVARGRMQGYQQVRVCFCVRVAVAARNGHGAVRSI